MSGKRPNHVDVAVGQRIRVLRLNAKLSQSDLGDEIGVTFQQVQKYENGANRVGAGRLMQIAVALNVPISAFFDGLGPPSKGHSEATSMTELMTAPHTFKLLHAFSGICDPTVQSAIVVLAETLSRRRNRRHR